MPEKDTATDMANLRENLVKFRYMTGRKDTQTDMLITTLHLYTRDRVKPTALYYCSFLIFCFFLVDAFACVYVCI